MADQIDVLRQALARPTAASSDFDLNPGAVPPEGRLLRAAGVLVPVIQGAQGLELVLTKRSSALRHHPGQIAFPGGKQDEADADVIGAALREAREEIGLQTEQVTLLGQLPTHETVTSFLMTPVVGLITGDFTPVAEPGEVDEVFQVPFSHVTNLDNYSVQSRRWRGQRRQYYTVPYGPYYVWGATARILRGLAERLAA